MCRDTDWARLCLGCGEYSPRIIEAWAWTVDKLVVARRWVFARCRRTGAAARPGGGSTAANTIPNQGSSATVAMENIGAEERGAQQDMPGPFVSH